MSRNPHLAAARLRRRNRRRVEGWGPPLVRASLATGAVVLLVPLVRPVFLRFLDEGSAGWRDGLQGVLLRAGLLLVATMALDVYTALIRSPERAVLDLHPVKPDEVVIYELVSVARARWWLVPALAALLVPVAFVVSPAAWLLAVGVLVGSFAAGLVGSAWMHLFAVEVAESERAAPLLDLLRGSNTRAQAAFIYAPGAVLAAAGGLVWVASAGAARAATGDPLAAVALIAPLGGAALAALRLPRLARATWFRATWILADVDARYAALGEREDGTRAYLDWVARWLPDAVARYALKDLRHGWRARRAWLVCAWLGGVAAALAGWGAHERAPGNAAALAAGAIWACATVGVLLDRDDPPFLREWLPGGGVPAATARLVVLAAWMQGCIWLAIPAVAVRHGAGASLEVLATALATLVVAVPLAGLVGRHLPRWGAWVYGPTAALAIAATAAWSVGGTP